MSRQRFEELVVWQKAMSFVTAIYSATASFPADERFGLTQQLRRATISIPSNIAEGQERATPPDFIRFLVMARGSANEVRTQLLISNRLEFLDSHSLANLLEQCDEVKRLLNGLMSSLESGRNTR